MFKSYEFGNPTNHKDGKYYWEYKLTDSEFGIASGEVEIEAWLAGEAEVGVAVIQEYSKRNLNVAANLAIALVWYQKQYPHFSVQYFIDNNKKFNPLFPPYEKDLQKYLVLL
jgi:hypothetical protein